MKNKIAAVVLTMAMLVPLTGNAAATYRSNNTTSAIGATKVYLGVKFGVLTVEPDASGADDIEVDNMGFVFGGHFNDYLSLEFDYTQTVSAEKEDFLGTTTKFRTDTTGIFLSLRTTGALYLKGRVGYSWIEQEVSSIGSDTVYGMAAGVGAGWEITDTFAVEGEYTIFPETDEFDRFGNAADLETNLLTLNLIWSYD